MTPDEIKDLQSLAQQTEHAEQLILRKALPSGERARQSSPRSELVSVVPSAGIELPLALSADAEHP